MSTVTNMKILVVEDDKPKLNAIVSFLREELKIISIATAKSLTSAVQEISTSTYDMCIVDMSIPTYDFDVDKLGGGLPQSFGGKDILRFLESEAPDTKAIIVTQYSEFSDGNGSAQTLEILTEQLLRKFRSNLLAVLFYASQKSDWRTKLRLAIIGEYDGN
ncbi:MAG: response regulator [Pseudomonas sp.]|uniref:response regulator n=1 Tax=Pseudomonas sp. TaxID=306 RepID=UPI002725A364|nr:response regulator [Pseudomonas sp.]MDO9331095.1 response regulator [Pseudomonas sp.]